MGLGTGGASGEELAKPILDMLPRLHVLVIGPGLGRDEITHKQVKAVILAARKNDPPVPLVLDADALWLVQADPDIIKGYKECILTPNVVEFGRLAKSMELDQSGDSTKQCQDLAAKLGGVCIETANGLYIEPKPMHGGVVDSYEDHRMATFGAILGLAVEGVSVLDIGCTSKTMPDFPGMWANLVT